jgi:hypothetical protein
MKYPPEKLAQFNDKQLIALSRNAEEYGALDQLEACKQEIDLRKKSKHKSTRSKLSGNTSHKDKAEEVLVTAQKAALSRYSSLNSFNNPWGDSKDGLIVGRSKISGSARHLPSLGPKSIAGETRLAYASHVSLSYGKSRTERALVIIEAVMEKPDSDFVFVVCMRCWNVEWPSIFSKTTTSTGFWEVVTENKYSVLGEYSINESDAAINEYLRAVDWMATLV